MVSYATPYSIGKRLIKPLLRTDRDFIMAVSGPTGEGKTTLGYYICKHVNPKFDMEKDIVYTKSQLDELIRTLPKYSAILIDEAINVLYKRDFMKGDQKELLKLLDMCRKRCLFMVFTLPIFWDLDNKILQSDRVKLWVHVVERGVGYMHTPDENYWGKDKWHRAENEKAMSKLNNKAIPYQIPNFRGIINFPDFTPGVKARYLAMNEVKSAYAEQDESKPRVVDPEKVKYSVFKELTDAGLVKPDFITQYANFKGAKPNTIRMRVRRAEPIQAYGGGESADNKTQVV